ncbi:MAG: transposase [Pirellulaceae bacterium]
MSTNPVSGKALAAGSSLSSKTPAASALPLTSEPADPITLFITWTTYGTWLPGDSRGWRKWKAGDQQPQPLLEDWCRDQMKDKPLFLNESQRAEVEKVIRKHANIRGWELHAVSARSNHVHVAVTVVPKVSGKALAAGSSAVKRVRDQFKANGTTALRRMTEPVTHEKVWTKGGDIEFIDTDDDLEQVVIYITEAQDRMERGK